MSPGYNASIVERWYPGPEGNTLRSLPRGLQRLAGVNFDVRGLIQLSGAELQTYDADQFPRSLRAIRVQQWAKRLHFLHGAVSEVMDGRKIGLYRVHYASGQTQEIAIVYGQDLRALWQPSGSSGTVGNAVAAWSGRNPSASERSMVLRLYRKTWDNPRPDDEIRTIDFESSMANSAPFLVAVTVDEQKLPAVQKQQMADVLSLLQANANSVPRVAIDTNTGPAQLISVRLNAHPVPAAGRSCDAFRFTTPAHGPMDLVWAFADSPDVHVTSWYIAPVKGRMKLGFEDWYHGASERSPKPTEFSRCTFQFLNGKKLQPHREYLIWFAFLESRPVDLRATLRFAPPGQVDPNKPETLVRALGWENLLSLDPGKMHRHYCLGAMK